MALIDAAAKLANWRKRLTHPLAGANARAGGGAVSSPPLRGFSVSAGHSAKRWVEYYGPCKGGGGGAPALRPAGVGGWVQHEAMGGSFRFLPGGAASPCPAKRTNSAFSRDRTAAGAYPREARRGLGTFPTTPPLFPMIFPWGKRCWWVGGGPKPTPLGKKLWVGPPALPPTTFWLSSPPEH